MLTKNLAVSFLQPINKALKLSRRLITKLNSNVDSAIGYLSFINYPNDIYVVTYPRSGTTWMLMILYQLTSNGETDFPHIYKHCPWLERTFTSKRDLTSLPSPRIFKTHLSYRLIPKPGKYIYIIRDVKDVMVSYFYFHQSYYNYSGTFSDFFKEFMRGKLLYGSWFKHVESWVLNKDELDILFLKYEDLSKDLPSGIQKIIDFCNFKFDYAQLPRVIERSSFAFMKQHEQKFDDMAGIEWEIKEFGNKSSEPNNWFIRKGKVGDWQQHLSSQQASIVNEALKKCSDRLQEKNFNLVKLLE